MTAGPAEYQRAFDELRQDDLMLRGIKRIMKKGKPTSVVDFLAEQRCLAMTALAGLETMLAVPDTMKGHERAAQLAIGYALRHAVPFMWTHEIRMLALAYNLPPHIIGPAAFPHAVSWWTWETSIGNTPDYHVDGHLIARAGEMRAAGLSIGGDGWVCFEFGSVGLDHRTSQPTVKLMWYMPDGTKSTELRSHGVMLGMAAFLNSHAVEVTKKRPGDTDTRWRGRRIGDPSSLNVVTLRSTVREAVAVERGEGPVWKQRWLVRGHLRAQWYPSLQSHRVVWIAPYLKGPEDAPVKVPIYRVAR